MHKAVFVITFKEYLASGAELFFVEVVSLLSRKSSEHTATLGTYFAGYHPIHFHCFGIGAFGVGKDVSVGNIQLVKEVISFQEMFVCLSWEAHDYINSYTGIGHQFTDFGYTILVEFP